MFNIKHQCSIRRKDNNAMPDGSEWLTCNWLSSTEQDRSTLQMTLNCGKLASESMLPKNLGTSRVGAAVAIPQQQKSSTSVAIEIRE